MFIVRNNMFTFPCYVAIWKGNMIVWDRRKSRAKIFTDSRLKDIFLNKNLIIEEF